MAKRVAPRMVEGVEYRRFRVRYKLRGRWRQMIRWSPGFPWVRDTVGQELLDRFGVNAIAPGSVTIRECWPVARERPARKRAESPACAAAPVADLELVRFNAETAIGLCELSVERREPGVHADVLRFPRLVFRELTRRLERADLAAVLYHEACRMNAARRIRALGIEWRLPPDNDQGADFALLRLLGFTVSVDGGLQVAPALLAPLTAKERGSSYGL